MNERPSVLIKGLTHPLLDKVITAMVVRPEGIEVTVDSGTENNTAPMYVKNIVSGVSNG